MTKITDEELLKAIWYKQITGYARSVIYHYAGGGYGVCGPGRSAFLIRSTIGKCESHLITDKISPSQIRKRINCLLKNGKICRYCRHHFYIENSKAIEAFEFAIQWWIDHGVPTGSTEGRMNTGHIEDFNGMVDKLKAELVDRFCRQSFEQTK